MRKSSSRTPQSLDSQQVKSSYFWILVAFFTWFRLFHYLLNHLSLHHDYYSFVSGICCEWFSKMLYKSSCLRNILTESFDLPFSLLPSPLSSLAIIPPPLLFFPSSRYLSIRTCTHPFPFSPSTQYIQPSLPLPPHPHHPPLPLTHTTLLPIAPFLPYSFASLIFSFTLHLYAFFYSNFLNFHLFHSSRHLSTCIPSIAIPGRLEVEDVVARAGDSAPTQEPAVTSTFCCISNIYQIVYTVTSFYGVT